MTNGNTNHQTGALHQAFSHMSRMHSSSSAAFFTSCFAYIAYLGYYAGELHRYTDGDTACRAVLIGAPLIIPLYLCLKYYVTNAAFRRVAEQIQVSPGLSLYEYMWDVERGLHRGPTGRMWTQITQATIRGRLNLAYWMWLGFFIACFFLFGFYFVDVLLRR